VGVFILAALLGLTFVIFMIGSRQRWFVRDFSYTTYFESAAGLNANMAVLYKGFTIGNVKGFTLNESDQVEVRLSIYDTYAGRVTEGSLVELIVSPIGLGSQLLFYPGRGSRRLEEGELIPSVHSPEGRALILNRTALVPSHEDSVTLLLSRANVLLDNLNRTALRVDAALLGSGDSSLGRAIGGAEDTLQGLSALSGDLKGALESVLGDIRPVLADINALADTLASPESGFSVLLDPQGQALTNLAGSLRSLAGVLGNLEKASAVLPGQMPQVAALIAELRDAIKTAEDVLVALTLNPLLKGGIPAPVRNRSSGTTLRDIPF
jgi:phospholipid/cholesterol/gamma-HCH transport system substrate-binding protein